MELGLECEGDVEGTMDAMVLREGRDGVSSGNRGARAASQLFPAAPTAVPASGWQPTITFTCLLPFSSCAL